MHFLSVRKWLYAFARMEFAKAIPFREEVCFRNAPSRILARLIEVKYGNVIAAYYDSTS
jgi:hypothetical protein